MIKLKVKMVERAFGKKVIPNIKVVGVDTASRTGWAILSTTKTYVKIDYGFTDTRGQEEQFRYLMIIDLFNNLFKNKYTKIVIEDVFFGRNVNTLKLLARLGMIVYVVGFFHNIKNMKFIGASRARANLGIKGNVKKRIVHQKLKELLNWKLKDEDIVDAIVLGFNGILKENTLL